MSLDFGLGHWYPVRDGDSRAVALYRRHYSCRKASVRFGAFGFTGPGTSMVLLTADALALFVWRKFIDHCIPIQTGVNCAVFRNESGIQSSVLIREACNLAWQRWPGERLYTYVNASKIRSVNPGYCFKMAGWRECGRSKGGLVILELLP